MKRKTTILSVGEKKDFDSYRKFHKQSHVIRSSGFVYRSIDFDRLFSRKAPVIKNERVTISGFGSFTVKTRKPRRGINPRTGKQIHIM